MIGEPTPERRCTYRRADGTQCKKWALVGLNVCRRHGGQLPNAKFASEKVKMLSRMEQFTHIDTSKPIDFIHEFEMEFRRTVARIKWYDEQLALLDEQALVWGKTKEEEVGASEFTGTNVTYESKVNTLHELQFRERQHLLAMEKVYIAARLDEKRLAIQKAQVESLDQIITGTLVALGINPADPHVRQTVREQMLGLPEARKELPA